MLSNSAGSEPLVMRSLLCAALIGIGAHALHTVGWVGGSSVGWLLESWVYSSLLVAGLVVMYRKNRSLYAGGRSEARTDPVTGLANRRQLMEDLAELTEAGSNPRVFALFDLDGFKSYNDSFGHPAGDALLAELAERLRTAVRARRSRLPSRLRVLHGAGIRPGTDRGRVLGPFPRMARVSRSGAHAASSSCPRRPTIQAPRCASRTAGCCGEEPPPPFARASR